MSSAFGALVSGMSTGSVSSTVRFSSRAASSKLETVASATRHHPRHMSYSLHSWYPPYRALYYSPL